MSGSQSDPALQEDDLVPNFVPPGIFTQAEEQQYRVDVTRVFTSAFRQASGPPLPNLRLECWQQGKDDDNTGITCFIAAVVGWKKGETAADKKAVSDSDPAADFATAHRLLFNELSRQSRELIRATSQSSAGGDGRAVGDENP
ncbi:hypothetical protein LTS18_002604, partial [Coniosporium uncinatum]